MKSIHHDISEDVTPECAQLLKSTPVSLGHGRIRSVFELMASWTYHAERLDAERGLEWPSARDAWNVHDYVAALILRDFVDDGLQLLQGEAQAQADRVVSDADRVLTSMTEKDDEELLPAFAADEAGPGWWWKRVPASGPIAEQLAASRG